ncbi:MAG TPA: helix-turn-helix domain-containing protein [Trebonia sp.]|jgi:predicted ArsR family transcriptional regulator|nr:helix-turn-helix domain-containing protein [Trebonia sp.]
MNTGSMLAPEGGPSLGPRREAILDMLRTADRPFDVREVARRMGLHPNTARFHLEALTEAGLAARAVEGRETPGRPRIGYRAAEDAPGGRRRYRLLAEMLATLIAGTIAKPGGAAEEAGREWGGYLASQPPPSRRPSADEAVTSLTAMLRDLGFEPQPVPDADGAGYQLRLLHCPFLEVAQQHQDVVCALHLGLMRGAFDRMRAPVTAGGLEPFVEPGLCVATLTARDD